MSTPVAGRQSGTVIEMRDLDGERISIERHWNGAYTIELSDEDGNTHRSFIGKSHLLRLKLALAQEAS